MVLAGPQKQIAMVSAAGIGAVMWVIRVWMRLRLVLVVLCVVVVVVVLVVVMCCGVWQMPKQRAVRKRYSAILRKTVSRMDGVEMEVRAEVEKQVEKLALWEVSHGNTEEEKKGDGYAVHTYQMSSMRKPPEALPRWNFSTTLAVRSGNVQRMTCPTIRGSSTVSPNS